MDDQNERVVPVHFAAIVQGHDPWVVGTAEISSDAVDEGVLRLALADAAEEFARQLRESSRGRGGADGPTQDRG